MNNLFNGFLNKNVEFTEEEHENTEIKEKKIMEYNFYDKLLQHPFIEKLDINGINKNEETYLILYRLKQFNGINYIEYYQKCLISLDNETDILLKISHINGRKMIKGIKKLGENKYTIIQIRNNTSKQWLVLWDIIINKHYYNKKIDINLVNFIISYPSIDNLIVNGKLSKKLFVLYCHVDDKYRNYIEKNDSIQYCQELNCALIKLNTFEDDDNIRNLCLINDEELDCNLMEKEYIIERKGNSFIWIFKNDKNIISYLK